MNNLCYYSIPVCTFSSREQVQSHCCLQERVWLALEVLSFILSPGKKKRWTLCQELSLLWLAKVFIIFCYCRFPNTTCHFSLTAYWKKSPPSNNHTKYKAKLLVTISPWIGVRFNFMLLSMLLPLKLIILPTLLIIYLVFIPSCAACHSRQVLINLYSVWDFSTWCS